MLIPVTVSPYIYLFCVLHRPESPDQRERMLSVFLSSNSQRHQQLIRYPAASSSLTTIHNINSSSSSSDPTLRLLRTYRIPISFLRHPDWKTEMREVGEERLRISGFYHDLFAPSTIELRGCQNSPPSPTLTFHWRNYSNLCAS